MVVLPLPIREMPSPKHFTPHRVLVIHLTNKTLKVSPWGKGCEQKIQQIWGSKVERGGMGRRGRLVWGRYLMALGARGTMHGAVDGTQVSCLQSKRPTYPLNYRSRPLPASLHETLG